jgi:hypothetical protein
MFLLILSAHYRPRPARHETSAWSGRYFLCYVTAYPTECKRALRARYALANSNRPTPSSDISARKRIMYIRTKTLVIYRSV